MRWRSRRQRWPAGQSSRPVRSLWARCRQRPASSRSPAPAGHASSTPSPAASRFHSSPDEYWRTWKQSPTHCSQSIVKKTIIIIKSNFYSAIRSLRDCPWFFVGGDRRTEGRERGGVLGEEAATPSPPITASGGSLWAPPAGLGRSPHRPKVFH